FSPATVPNHHKTWQKPSPAKDRLSSKVRVSAARVDGKAVGGSGGRKRGRKKTQLELTGRGQPPNAPSGPLAGGCRSARQGRQSPAAVRSASGRGGSVKEPCRSPGKAAGTIIPLFWRKRPRLTAHRGCGHR